VTYGDLSGDKGGLSGSMDLNKCENSRIDKILCCDEVSDLERKYCAGTE